MRKLLLLALTALTLAAAARVGAEIARRAEEAVLPDSPPPYPAFEMFPAAPAIAAERGFAVAVDGDWLAMGAPRDGDEAGKDAGAVYLFRWSGTTWDQEAKLLAALPRRGARLGFALAMRDGILAAAAPGEGAVYLFAQEDGVWVQKAKLTGTDHGAGAFGRALALDSGRLAVGAVEVDGTDGAVYVFDHLADTWDLKQKVRLQPGQRRERFGSAVSLAGDVLVVGAPGYDIGTGPRADDAGAVYVFQPGPAGYWRQRERLLPPDSPPLAGQQFGSAVATDGTQIFVGAPTADPAGTNSGAVYWFVQSTAGWEPRLLPAVEGRYPGDQLAGDQLGASLALSGGLLVVGAPEPPPAPGKGKVYVIRPGDVAWSGLPEATNGEVRDLGGFAVAVDDERGRVVEGAVLGDQGDGAAGAAWSFHCADDSACAEEAEAVARDDDLSGNPFGVSVALSGDFMAVGAETDDTVIGAVYLYRRAGRRWRQERRLTSPYPQDGFGSAVALEESPEGTLLAVGAPRTRFFPVSPPRVYPNGGVDLFVRSGSSWVFEASLAPPSAAPKELGFGTSVAISHGVVAVGMPGSGEVHLFRKETAGWTETVLIGPTEGFGSAVSLHGDVLAIGAPRAADGRGEVYVSVHDGQGWSKPQPLGWAVAVEGPDLALGSAVAAGDGVIAVGAPGFRDQTDSLSGVVVVLELSSGKVSPLSALGSRRFGSTVAMLGNRLVAGGPGDVEAGSDDLGRATVFERQDGGDWKCVADLDALQPLPGDRFGAAVALSEGSLVVASPGPARGDRVTEFDLSKPPSPGVCR